MHFLVLGCGTIVQHKTCYHCSGYLVDHRILFDCGPGIWHALCKANISVPEINILLLSHFHVDHTSDLGALLLSRYLQKDALREALILIGPAGLSDWFNQLSGLLGSWVKELKIRITEAGESHLQIPNYKIEAGSTPHTENSLCYRLSDEKGSVLFYSGDSGYHKNLIRLADLADLAVLEASCLDRTEVSGHLTPVLAGEIARQAGVKRLMLTHRYPEVNGSVALREARKKFKGRILLAADGLEIIL